MTMTAEHALPQLEGGVFLTDGGLETTLVFHDGIDLPCFAAYIIVMSEDGRRRLARYYKPYLESARDFGAGFVLESPTWRASRDWGAKIGHSPEEVAEANRAAVRLLRTIREEAAPEAAGPLVVSGQIGPRGDGYVPGVMMSPAEAADYHAEQIEALRGAGADLVTALTLNYADEAIGIVRAAQAAESPVVISFTVETDGRLPSGQALGEAIAAVDAATGGGPAYYMINCAHPTHFAGTVAGDGSGGGWTRRIFGLRVNASKCSHEELDNSTELDVGDPHELGRDHLALFDRLPNLRVLGGCCGTDDRHVRAIAETVMARKLAA
jgi:S-methylmethionine-dependent homocysteine/selenocysteine methylase